MTTSFKALTLQNIERTIHYAFQKVDSSNPLTRQKIYKTIWSTHERLLMSKKHLNNSEKAKKRKQLILLFKKIEKEYHEQFNLLKREKGIGRFSLGIGPEEEKHDSITDFTIFTQKKSFWIPICLLALIVLSAIVFISWSFYNCLIASDHFPGSHKISTTSRQIGNKYQNDWTQIFNPSNIGALTTRGAATTEIHNEAGVHFVRIQTDTIGDVAIIEIGQSALMKLRGKTATIGIIARSVGKNITQLNIACDFGIEQNAEKQWFELSQNITPLLFQVHVPRSMSIPVKLYIKSTLSNKDHGIDIFSILAKEK